MASPTPPLSSLPDALLDMVLCSLAKEQRLGDTIKTIALISKLFAALLKQPLTVWESVTTGFSTSGSNAASSETLATWTSWLASVAPAVRRLRVAGVAAACEPQASPPCHWMEAAAVLLPLKRLQVGPHCSVGCHQRRTPWWRTPWFDNKFMHRV